MSANIVDLEKALRAGVASCLTVTYALENMPFDKPTDGSEWGSVFILRNEPEVRTMGDGGQDMVTGILQVDINGPLLRGSSGTAALSRDVLEYLRPGRVLVHGDTAVWIQGARRFGREVEGYYRMTLSIVWESRVDR